MITLDTEDLRMVVTLDEDGLIDVVLPEVGEHDAEDLDALAKALAYDPHPVAHPGPGRAVLACRCGKVLDSADMHRPRRRDGELSRALIERIVCADCAGAW